MNRTVEIGGIRIGSGSPLVLIAGPCVIESAGFVLEVADQLRQIAIRANVPLIFKSSYDKANRTSHLSPRGPGLREGLKVLERVKGELAVPVLSDVHCREEVEEAAAVLDVIQIPAFLCRQTDLLLAAASTGKAVNVKKGQFLAPWDVQPLLAKLTSTGNQRILVTERGASFGYNNLVSDMRSLVILQRLGYPVVFDGTHSLQLPGGLGSASGGQREFVPYLTRAAVATGCCDVIFLEVHPQPDTAPSDGPNMLPLQDLPALLQQLKAIDDLVRPGVQG